MADIPNAIQKKSEAFIDCWVLVFSVRSVIDISVASNAPWAILVEPLLRTGSQARPLVCGDPRYCFIYAKRSADWPELGRNSVLKQRYWMVGSQLPVRLRIAGEIERIRHRTPRLWVSSIWLPLIIVLGQINKFATLIVTLAGLNVTKYGPPVSCVYVQCFRLRGT